MLIVSTHRHITCSMLVWVYKIKNITQDRLVNITNIMLIDVTATRMLILVKINDHETPSQKQRMIEKSINMLEKMIMKKYPNQNHHGDGDLGRVIKIKMNYNYINIIIIKLEGA